MLLANFLVSFYRFWHGMLHLRGAGFFLRRCARILSTLRSYPLSIPNVGIVHVDFRDGSAFCWVNKLLGELHQEEGLIKFLKRACSNNAVFWDVGANIGIVSASLFQSNPSATFCLFEANPDLSRRLSHLFAQHRNVTVVQKALSDREGSAFLDISANETAVASVSAEDRNSSVQISLTTAENFLAKNPELRPTLIKIDVEGHETSVFAGMRNIIKQNQPIIVFEHLFLDDATIRSLVPEGYQLLFIDDVKGTLSDKLDRIDSRNSALIPDNKVAGLGTTSN